MNNIKYVENINIEKILIWDKNPRFQLKFSVENNFDIDYENDDCYIQMLIKQEIEQTDEDSNDNKNLKYFKELIESLLKNGFIKDNDQIFVKKSTKSDYYFALEGNRRIAAMKICNYLKENKNIWIRWFMENFGNDYFDLIRKKLIKFEKIGCFVFQTDDPKIIKQYEAFMIINNAIKKNMAKMK